MAPRSGLPAAAEQASGALGWQVVSTDSQLDPGSISGSGSQMAGDGRWQVTALDERLQAATVAGVLHYDVAVDQPQPTEANVTTHLRGALSEGETELALDIGTQAAQLQVSPQLTMTMKLRLTRAGQMSLGLGVLRVTVLASTGQPAGAPNFLGVVVYPAGDHQRTTQSPYGNPAETRLPPGRYDLQVSYLSGASSYATGLLQAWVNDVEVRSGETTEREVNLHVGEATVIVFESAGRLMDTSDFAVRIFPSGTLTQAAATLIYTNTSPLWLPAGKYDVVGDVLSTQLAQRGPLATFEVREGETTQVDIDFKLARIRVEVDGSDGQPVDAESLYGSASSSAKPDEQFSYATQMNPLELWVVAGESFDVAITVGNRPVKTVATQTLHEGETRDLRVSLPATN